jgi:putative drug exporter of the RND superfamily
MGTETHPTNSAHSTGRLARLGDLAFRRRGRMVLAWLVGLVLLAAGGSALAGQYDAEYSTPGSESDAAARLIDERFGGASSSETIDVVWEAPGGAMRPDIKRRMDDFTKRASRLEGIGRAEPPRVSRDRTIAMRSLQFTERGWDVPTETGEQLISMAQRSSGDGLRIELGGGPVRDAEGGGSPEVASLLAAAIILLIAFGSIVAAGLPLVTALFGLAISTGLIALAVNVIDIPEWAPAVSSLLGIGVGIDYALLILTRFRTALARGADTRSALVESVSTAGRSVLVAGTTVMIALFGLFLMGLSYARGVAIAAGIAVLVVMLAAVTLVPRSPGLPGAAREPAARARARSHAAHRHRDAGGPLEPHGAAATVDGGARGCGGADRTLDPRPRAAAGLPRRRQ